MSEQARRWLKPGAAVGTTHFASPDSGCPHDGERRTVIIIGTGSHDGPAHLCGGQVTPDDVRLERFAATLGLAPGRSQRKCGPVLPQRRVVG